MSSRLASIQQLRGLAALLVVLVHAFDVVDRLPDEAARSSISRVWLFNDFGASGVDLFFVLSGFVMTLGLSRYSGEGGWRAFLHARAVRILPLFWLLSIAFVVLLGLAPEWRSLANTLTLLPLFDDLQYSLPPIWVGWTLAFEAAFYLIVAGSLRARRPAFTVISVIAAASLAGWLFQPSLPLTQILLNPIMAEFGFGAVACLAWKRGIPRSAAVLLAIGGAGLLLGPRVLAPESIFSPEARKTIDASLGFTRAALWGFPWALILAGCVALDREEGARGRNPLAVLGNASYALYLTHAMLMAAVEQWHLIPPIWPPLVIAMLACASFALGLATHWALERPLARLLDGKGAKRLPQARDPASGVLLAAEV